MRMNYAGPSQIRQAIHGARQEVLLSLPGDNGRLQDEIDVVAAHGVTGADGIAVRLYVPSAARGVGETPAHQLAALAKDGMEIHSTSAPTPRMAIIDRSVVVMACNQADYAEGALIGQGLPITPMLVRSLSAATAPAAAEDGELQLSEDGQLGPLSREVLRQLTRGTKDEAAAREMGMALRTYRRTVARLMESLDARSRFQAGFLAAQRGWL